MAGYHIKFPATHHFKPLPDVIKCGMRPAFIGGVKTGAIVIHDDLSAGIRVQCPDGDVQRLGIRVQSVLDGKVIGQSVTKYQRAAARAAG